MKDQPASCITYTVVSAKKPGHFIVRGIKKWTTPDALQGKVQKFVALFDPEEIEWTFHDYKVPWYMEYGNGDLPRHGHGGDGIYVFPIHCDSPSCDSYGPARKLEAL